MTMQRSNLDTERFRRFHAVMLEGATEGERAAAKINATVMAKKAGMTLLDAIVAGTQSESAAADYLERRTNADKASAVRSLLASHPSLADREIARRAAVSPQTVSNWRKRLSSPTKRSAV